MTDDTAPIPEQPAKQPPPPAQQAPPPPPPPTTPPPVEQPAPAPRRRWAPEWGTSRSPLLIAIGLLLAGCLLGAGGVAVGMLISHRGDDGPHRVEYRDGPGDRFGPGGPGMRERRGDFPPGRRFGDPDASVPAPSGPPAAPSAPAPTPSA
jgi:hypothetical protein